jgi:cell wall-associated NlpC family hydrolase
MFSTTSSRVAARLIAAPLVLTVMVTGQAAGSAHASPVGATVTSTAHVDAPRILADLARDHAVVVQAREERHERRVAAAAARREREAAAIGQRIVAAAAAQAGKPYVYGATGSSAFDCSGLTGWAYAAVGIHLPRTSGAQAAVMTRVSNPMPGDLVYMPGHIGIYAGNGQMWHAPHTGDVVRLATIWTSNVTYGRVR